MAPTLITVTLPLLLKKRPLISSCLFLLLLYFKPVLLSITLLCGLGLCAYSLLSSSSSSSSSSREKEKEEGNTTWLRWIEGLDKAGRSWIEKKLKEEGIPLSDRPSLETLMDLIQSSFGDVLAINPLQFKAHNPPATKDTAPVKNEVKHVTFASSQISLPQSPSTRNPKVSDGSTVELVKEQPVKKTPHHSERTRSLAIRPDNQVVVAVEKAWHLKLPREDDDLASHRAKKTQSQSPRNPNHGETSLHRAEETLAPIILPVVDSATRRSPASKIPIADDIPAKKNRTPKILPEGIGPQSGALKKIPEIPVDNAAKESTIPKKIPSGDDIPPEEAGGILKIPRDEAGGISKIPRDDGSDIDRTKQGMSSKIPFVNDVTGLGISSKIPFVNDVTGLGISSKIRADDVTGSGISSKIRADDVTGSGISSKIRADDGDGDDDDGDGIAKKGMFRKVPNDERGSEKASKAPRNLPHSPVATTTPPRFASSILPKTSPASKFLEVSRRIFQKDDTKSASRMMPSSSSSSSSSSTSSSSSNPIREEAQSSSEPPSNGAVVAPSNKGFSMRAPSSRKILEACRMFSSSSSSSSSPKEETKVLGTMPPPRVSMEGCSPKGVESMKKKKKKTDDQGNNNDNKVTEEMRDAGKPRGVLRVSGNKLQHKLLSRSLKGEVCGSDSEGNDVKSPFVVVDGEKLEEDRDGLVDGSKKKPSPNARNGKRERT